MAMAIPQLMERARLAWWRSPLPVFLRWWGGELAAVLPGRFREWLQRGPEVLWLTVTHDAVSVQRARSRTLRARIPASLSAEEQRAAFAQACADIEGDDRRLLLVVPAAQALQRRLVIPLAAAGDPRRVARYEIDRQTPFKADEVYFDARVSAAPAPTGQVGVDLFVVPRAIIDPELERLAMLDAHTDAIDVCDGDGTLAGIDLLPAARRPRRLDRRRRANGILIAICILLLVLVLSQWLGNRQTALAAMRAEVVAMHTRAIQSEHLRAQLTGAVAASKFLVKRKAAGPSALAVLDDLSRRLPSTTWLDALTLDDTGELDIKGEAVKAAALVNRISQSPLLGEPRLQGVIQPDPATGKERFELTAQVRKAGARNAH